MKEYFFRLITGRIDVYRSFFLHFVLVLIMWVPLILVLDYLDEHHPLNYSNLGHLYTARTVYYFYFLLLVIGFVGAMVSAVRTLVSGGEPFFPFIPPSEVLGGDMKEHRWRIVNSTFLRIFSGLVIVLLSVWLYYLIVERNLAPSFFISFLCRVFNCPYDS